MGTYKNALRNTFKEKIVEIKEEIKTKNILALFMVLIGISILGIGYILQELTSLIIFEIFLVASWVFIWRSMELVFFDKPRLKLKKRICVNIFLSEINHIMLEN